MIAAQDITIADAIEEDCDQLTSLCLRSKAHWGYDQVFLERCVPLLEVTRRRLGIWRVRKATRATDELLGVSAVSIEGNEAELELLFVEPQRMGLGVGRRLFEDVVAWLNERGVSSLWILSDPGAEPFYKRCGAVRVGTRPSDAIPGRSLPWLRVDLGSK